jgi:hypothetical protein
VWDSAAETQTGCTQIGSNGAVCTVHSLEPQREMMDGGGHEAQDDHEDREEAKHAVRLRIHLVHLAQRRKEVGQE